MNNTLCLGVFVALVYFRGLAWVFSAETLVIFISVIVAVRVCVRRPTVWPRLCPVSLTLTHTRNRASCR